MSYSNKLKEMDSDALQKEKLIQEILKNRQPWRKPGMWISIITIAFTIVFSLIKIYLEQEESKREIQEVQDKALDDIEKIKKEEISKAMQILFENSKCYQDLYQATAKIVSFWNNFPKADEESEIRKYKENMDFAISKLCSHVLNLHNELIKHYGENLAKELFPQDEIDRMWKEIKEEAEK